MAALALELVGGLTPAAVEAQDHCVPSDPKEVWCAYPDGGGGDSVQSLFGPPHHREEIAMRQREGETHRK